MSVLRRTTKVYQSLFKDSKTFNYILEFIKEPDSNLEEDEEGNDVQVDTISIRRNIDGTTLTTDINEKHRSESVCKTAMSSHGSSLEETFIDKISESEVLAPKEKGCCNCSRSATFFVQYSFIDFSDLIFSEKISRVLDAYTLESY